MGTGTRVVNLRNAKYDVYIGRAGKGQDGYFGNPYPLVGGDREACLAKYKVYFLSRVESDQEFRRKVLELRGKALGCFCKPLSCHGDVLVEWLEPSRLPGL